MSDKKQPPAGSREKLRQFVRTPLGILVILGLFILILSAPSPADGKQVPLTRVQEAIAEKQVRSGLIRDRNQEIQITLKDGTKLRSNYAFEQGDDLQEALREAGAESKVVPGGPGLGGTLLSLLPFIIIIGLVLFFLSRSGGGGPGSVLRFSRSKARLMDGSQPKTTFADVAGADEALEELREVRDFLAQPDRYTKLGAKIPRGVLLVGPPGTGKTLLAKAVAGEAGVPFYSISGSEFVEMFVGVGAGRVRDLFEKAKANSPCIVFIDEIDAVGRQRGAGVGGGNDEREQTLNQLLVEMDGFGSDQTIIVMAATNRPDVLDPALLRPGRFDRQIIVDRPDLAGRRAILAVHAKGKPVDPATDLESIARATPGFTGADLANLLNEAALLTARAGQTLISQAQLEEAVERVVAGPERKSRVMSDQEKKIIAYHEAGHALVARALTHADPVHKVTILPRGRALGYTMTLPTDDKFLKSRSELLDELAMLLGGRTAEEVVFHEPTTGASNDIEKASTIARAMVTEYGMSDLLGARRLGDSGGDVFLGRSMAHQRDYSEDLAAQVDTEVRRLLDEAHDEAYEVLVANRDALDAIVSELLERETLSAAEVAEVFASVEKRPGRGRYVGVPAAGGKRKRLPLERPPVLTPTERAAAEAVSAAEAAASAADAAAEAASSAASASKRSSRARTGKPRTPRSRAATSPS